jgi:hypothetical protein
MKRNEVFVHVAVRNFLKKEGWQLIAGQYPGGSDDELHVLNIFDPELARDQSPDHRRHSFGKLVPDLIAHKENRLLVIEAKPYFSQVDKEKLELLFRERKRHFITVLEKFAQERGFEELLPVDNLQIIPALAFLDEALAPKDDFAYLRVVDLDKIRVENLKV